MTPAADPGPVRVPIHHVYLSGPAYRRVERFAAEHHTTVGVVVSHLAERAAGRQRDEHGRKKRRRVTPELEQRVRELAASGDVNQNAIARQLDISAATVSRIVGTPRSPR